MELREILQQNAGLSDGLDEYVNSVNGQGQEAPLGDDNAQILMELAQDESISDEELEMISEAADQLGPNFEEWLVDYMETKGVEEESEYGDEEILPEQFEA